MSQTCDIFFSLRFNDNGPMKEARLLQEQLKLLNINAVIVDVRCGANIESEVVSKLHECRLAVLFATRTYGKRGEVLYSTCEELQYILTEEIPFFLIKMCDELEDPNARFRLNFNNTCFIDWRMTKPMPINLVEEIKRTYQMTENPVRRRSILSIKRINVSEVTVFFSMEYVGDEGEMSCLKAKVTKVKEALEKERIFPTLVDTSFGEIAVDKALKCFQQAGLVVIFGTEGYGRLGSATRQEYTETKINNKNIFVIQMCDTYNDSTVHLPTDAIWKDDYILPKDLIIKLKERYNSVGTEGAVEQKLDEEESTATCKNQVAEAADPTLFKELNDSKKDEDANQIRYSWSPKRGSCQFVSVSWDCTAHLWGIFEPSPKIFPLASFCEFTNRVTSVVIMNDNTIATGSYDGIVRLSINSHTMSTHLTLDVQNIVNGLTNCNDKLVSADSGGFVKIWNVKTKECNLTLAGHSKSVSSVSEAGNGIIASGSIDKTVRVWDVEKGRIMTNFTDSDYVSCVLGVGNGEIISGSNKINLFDLRLSHCVMSLSGQPDDRIYSAAVKDEYIFSGSSNGFNIWDRRKQKESVASTFSNINSEIRSMAVLGDSCLVSGSKDGAIHAWSLKSRSIIDTVSTHTKMVSAIAAFPDLRHV